MGKAFPSRSSLPLFGIAGWSNSGKTTLIEKLTLHFSGQGLRVATIKHTHHKFDIDTPGSDTARHRAAGAAETAIVSGSRVAVIEEIESAGEPALEVVAARLKPADIILVEGYKSATSRRSRSGGPPSRLKSCWPRPIRWFSRLRPTTRSTRTASRFSILTISTISRR